MASIAGLESFLAVARTGNLTEAARELHVTQPFCHDCTRARLSAEGKLYTCLFASRGHDLRALVRDEAISDAELDERLRGLWRMRADRYSELRTEGTPVDLPKVEMSHIGG